MLYLLHPLLESEGTMADAPEHFLHSVWDAAEIAWYNDEYVCPWKAGTEQRAVWELAQKAAAEEFAWQQTDEAKVQDELEEQRYWEARQADVRDNAAPDADHISKYLRLQIDHAALPWDERAHVHHQRLAPAIAQTGERTGERAHGQRAKDGLDPDARAYRCHVSAAGLITRRLQTHPVPSPSHERSGTRPKEGARPDRR
jgi:glycine/D-amino acid oxidase-like deaminating enzyme